MNWFAKAWFGAVAALLTGGLFAASLDVGPMGPLALIAPIPLLIYALSAARWWSVGLAAAAARIISLAGVVYVYDQLPLVALLVFVVIYALIYAAVVLTSRWLARFAPPALAVFTYPLLLVSAEFLLGLVSPHGSFGAMGYALVDILPLLQVASVGGVAALTFCVALVPMTAAVALVRPQAWRSVLAFGTAPVLLVLVGGALRLTQPTETQTRVALVGLDADEARAYRDELQGLETARSFAAQVRLLASAHAEFIVLPEKQLGGARRADAESGLLASAAADASSTVIAGFDEVLPDGSRVNTAQVLMPGQRVERYRKRRLIPGLELDYTAGHESMVMGTRGVAICKDMDFPDMIRQYGQAGVQLLLVPAWDFVLDGRLHSRMALVRGVENGFAIARAAAAGRLTASDRYGRVIAEAATSRAVPVTLVADLGLRGGGTAYTRIGDLFAWVSIACAALLVGWRSRRRTVLKSPTLPTRF
ncbi:MAG: nitrilase-related carbon-nitrogen hydrolase [Pseudomonadota bacterium]